MTNIIIFSVVIIFSGFYSWNVWRLERLECMRYFAELGGKVVSCNELGDLEELCFELEEYYGNILIPLKYQTKTYNVLRQHITIRGLLLTNELAIAEKMIREMEGENILNQVK